MAAKTIQDLFVHELSDIYSAEKQLTKALPRLARAASEEELKKAFEAHAEETQRQVERIDAVAGDGHPREAPQIRPHGTAARRGAGGRRAEG